MAQRGTPSGAEPPDNVVPLIARDLAEQLIASGATPEQILRAVTQGMMGRTGMPGGFGGIQRRRPVLLQPREQPVTYRLRVELRDVTPPVWRTVDMASDLTLDEVHTGLMAVMGWEGSHLHHFVMGPGKRHHDVLPFATQVDEDMDEIEEDSVHESTVRLDQVLAEPGQRLHHDYDFGDGWEHTITVKKVLPRDPDDPPVHCVGGARACPPEDCGGPWGYQDVIAAVRGEEPHHISREELLDWLPPGFDPERFDVTEVNDVLAQIRDGASFTVGGLCEPLSDVWSQAVVDYVGRLDPAGASEVTLLLTMIPDEPPELTEEAVSTAVAGVRVLLDMVGQDGLPLTGAGYLKPAVVTELVQRLDLTDHICGQGNREDQTPAVYSLRQAAQRAKLVRKYKNRLVLSPAARKAGDDDRALLRQLLTALPAGKGAEFDAGVAILLATAVGMEYESTLRLVAALITSLGWTIDGRRANALQVASLTWPTAEVLAAFDPEKHKRDIADPAPEYLRSIAAWALRGDRLP